MVVKRSRGVATLPALHFFDLLETFGFFLSVPVPLGLEAVALVLRFFDAGVLALLTVVLAVGGASEDEGAGPEAEWPCPNPPSGSSYSVRR